MPTLTCDEVLSQLWEYLDEELAREPAEQVRLHLDGCRTCWTVYRVDGALLRRVGRLEIITLAAPEPLTRRVRLLARNL